MTGNTEFKRIVLGFHQSTADKTAMRLAADFAELLHLDLLGVFISDESISNLAGLPFAREFRSLGGGWRPIDVDELDRALELSARGAQRLFDDMAKALRTECRFQIMKGSAANMISAVFQAGDIAIIAEPATPTEWLTRPPSWIVETALQSAASVLLVPRKIARRWGSVVAIATAPDDPCIAAAFAIAAAAKENLLVIETFRTGGEVVSDFGEIAAAAGINVETLSTRGLPLTDPRHIAAIFAPLEERLVVISRSPGDGNVASTIASSRRIPVLVVEPPRSDDVDTLPRD